jgi:hypothetical protein
MRRRDFIKGIVGSATGWPLAARAQQGEHIRRIGVLMLQIGADDPEVPAIVGAFSQGLAETGWIIGRNARIDTGAVATIIVIASAGWIAVGASFGHLASRRDLSTSWAAAIVLVMFACGMAYAAIAR